ncbi:hypothetical protein IGI37_003237 [Enterococcus sp. AZ194]|uniref:BMC domain-containing protein n=1 Tax=Enterococcus sp. AZ194 TaxID=2774629 RepID=UPI003F21DCD5
MKALGMIEVRGFLGAVSVADAALKAADVTLLKAEIIKGGLTTVELLGDVAAVNAAVEVGAEVAKELDCLIAQHVISRIDQQTELILSKEEPEMDEKANASTVTAMTATTVEEEQSSLAIERESKESVITSSEVKGEGKKESADQLLSELKSQKVVDLRKKAYKMNVSELKKGEIKFANKQSLIDAIMAEIERSESDWN